MSTIQWYPGHIAKAERKLQERLGLVDVVLEVIDARIPVSTKYDNIERLTGEKPRLLILNKADLADEALSDEWKKYFEAKTGLEVILTSSHNQRDIAAIIKAAADLGKPKIEKMMAQGRLPRAIRAMVIGMPNVGKSSLINKIIKSSKTKTGCKAGITRAPQWIRINPKMELLDMPGIIPMKLENQKRAMKLAIVNSIGENAYDSLEVAQELISLLEENCKELLFDNYKLANDTLATLENIAMSRNWLLSGGVPDINRCAESILTDFRNGRIGRITLESPPKAKN